MKIYNRKKKEWVELSEAYSQWKEGMKNITPLQQTITVQFGQLISAIGVIWGIIFSIRLGYWWMMIILIGGLVVLIAQYIGNWQRKVILKEREEIYKNAMEVENGFG